MQNPRLDAQSVNELYSTGDYRRYVNDTQESMDRNERARGERIAEFVTSGSHLDVGCSRGYLLELTRDKGCEVLGVEPNEEYVTSPDVMTVPDIDMIDNQFDTVTCIHALEHVHNPIEFAFKLCEAVKTGGRLILEVPSDKSPGGPMRLYHLWHFQPWVIGRMFDGMELVDFRLTPHNFFIFQKVK